MGAIFNAQANHSPRAGHRRPADPGPDHPAGQPHQPRRDPHAPPARQVVLRAGPRRGRAARARPRRPPRRAAAARARSSSRSRWTTGTPRSTRPTPRHAIAREVSGRAVADPEAVRALAERLDAASNPVLVAGPDIDASRRLGRRRRPRRAPAPAGLGEPGDRRRPPRLPRGPSQLPRRAAAGDRPGRPDPRGPRPDPRRRQLGLPLLPPHPRPAAARGRDAGRDHQRSRRGRARADGRRDRRRRRAHPRGAARGRCPSPRAPRPSPTRGPQEIPATDPLNSSTVHTALAEVLPEDAIVVLESPASTLALRNQLRLSRPGSYYFSAGGGLGFGLAASVGVQLAQPDRPVVCVLGEGSAQYAITAFWSAVAYKVPVTFLVLRNSEYAILKWFAEVEQVTGAPGLDLPALDVAAVAAGYGVDTRQVERPRRGPRRALDRARLLAAASWSKSRSSRACRSSRRPWRCSRAAADARSRRRRRPRPRLARRRARRSRCAASSRPCSAPTACSAAPATSSATPPTPAPTGCCPQAVVMAHDADDVAKVLDYGRRSGTPVVFRAGGTSLNGQGQSDGILVDVRRHFGGVAVEEGGELARVKPGTVLGHANRVLAPHGRKLGPDPASTDIATVGGVIANNSGGMRCGVDHGLLLDGALADLRPALGDDDRHRRAGRRRALRRGRAGAGRRPRGDPRRDPRRRRAERAHPAQVRDQEHDRLPALRLPRRRRAAGDLPPPAGRLGGHARPSSPRPSSRPCRCRPARPPPGSTSPASTRRSRRSATSSTPAPRAVELMVAPALITAAWNMLGAPEEWKELPPESAVLLVEFGAETDDGARRLRRPGGRDPRPLTRRSARSPSPASRRRSSSPGGCARASTG